MAPKAAAGQVVSGREYMDPIPVGWGDVASAPSDLACTTGKDTGYYSRLNVRASGALYDIRLPIRALANVVKGGGGCGGHLGGCGVEQELQEGAGFFEHHRGKMEHFGLHYGAPKFWGGACPRGALPRPPVRVQELASRAGKQLGGRGLKRAHDEPAEPRATPAPTPTRKAPKPSGSAAAAVGVGSGGREGFGGVGGMEAAARRGTCEALGDLYVPSTADIVSGVVAGLGKSRLNISRDIGEFSRTSLTSLREANASLKEELKVAPAEGDAKDRRIAGLETMQVGRCHRKCP